MKQKNSHQVLLAITLFLFAISCSKNKMAFKTNAHQNFDSLWSLIDRNYGHFPVKSIDWDSVKLLYKPRMNNVRNEDELFAAFSEILSLFKDGHLILNTGAKSYSYNYYKNFPVNYITIQSALKDNLSYRNNNTIGYATFPGNIGYLLIASWGANVSEYKLIDTALNDLAGTKGLIIDIRNNTGGNAVIADSIFSKFIAAPTITSYVKIRNGVGRNDFTPFLQNTTNPSTGIKYSKPIVLLTNKKCFSSTEYFILAMKTINTTKQFGGVTGGGSANNIEKRLPNGWRVSIPTWLLYDRSQITYEGTGIRPDSLITISSIDITTQFDRIVAAAREYLK